MDYSNQKEILPKTDTVSLMGQEFPTLEILCFELGMLFAQIVPDNHDLC